MFVLKSTDLQLQEQNLEALNFTKYKVLIEDGRMLERLPQSSVDLTQIKGPQLFSRRDCANGDILPVSLSSKYSQSQENSLPSETSWPLCPVIGSCLL